MIDTHCHIQSIGISGGERQTNEVWAKGLRRSPDDVISEARANGVETIICVGCDLADSNTAIEFVADRPTCYASIGIHPHEAKDYSNEKGLLDAFSALVKRSKVVAIGETGLDYFYRHTEPENQKLILRFQIELAIANNLPLIFHVREAFDDFWPIFESYPPGIIRGVLHSFTDSVENLKRAESHGLYIGVNGIATFANNQQQNVMYRTISQQLLLLETDAPFLTPNPYRGTINEPKHISTIAEFLAELRGEDLDKLASTTTANAKTLFHV